MALLPPHLFFFTFIEALGSVSSWEWLGSQEGFAVTSCDMGSVAQMAV